MAACYRSAGDYHAQVGYWGDDLDGDPLRPTPEEVERMPTPEEREAFERRLAGLMDIDLGDDAPPF
jgi:hypothetical protein